MRNRIEPLSSRRLVAAVLAVLASIGAAVGWVAYENSRVYRILAACSGPLPASLRPPCLPPPPIILPLDPVALTWNVLVGVALAVVVGLVPLLVLWHGLRNALAILTATLMLSACGARPVLPAGAVAVPTDENLVSSAESGILCTLSATIPPVVGMLEGDPSDQVWSVWLRAEDGRRIYILWPRGFSVRFDPAATLLDESGATFLNAGSPLTLEQVGPDPAKGTKDRPYVATGLIATGLGQAQHCYTHRA